EQHTNKDDHRWQLQTLAALHLLRPDMVIGFEAFPRRLQPVLDQWVAGKLDAEQFLQQSQWNKVWGYAAELYMPLFQFARINRIPMIALNVDISLPDAVRKQGWDNVPQADRHGISRPAPAPQSYVDTLYKVFKQHGADHAHADINRTDPRFRHFVQAQTVWDRAMAQALAAQAQSEGNNQPPLVVGIMGVGHVRNGYGVPHQLRALGVEHISTLLPVNMADDECPSLPSGYADAVFVLPASPAASEHQPPRPRLGVHIENTAHGVRITQVEADSLAQHSGLQAGDNIITLAGRPVVDTTQVISAIHAQPPGTWLPVQIRRRHETFARVIKFPIAP